MEALEWIGVEAYICAEEPTVIVWESVVWMTEDRIRKVLATSFPHIPPLAWNICMEDGRTLEEGLRRLDPEVLRVATAKFGDRMRAKVAFPQGVRGQERGIH
jgi:hypothetical protein